MFKLMSLFTEQKFSDGAPVKAGSRKCGHVPFCPDVVVYESIMTIVRRVKVNPAAEINERENLRSISIMFQLFEATIPQKMKTRFEARLTIDTTLKMKRIMSYI